MRTITCSSDLIKAFHIENDQYFDITPFDPQANGFSVQRFYPTDIPFKPAKTSAGSDDMVALIKILVNDEQYDGSAKVPLIVNAGVYSRFVGEHFWTNSSHPDSPTKETIALSRKTPAPLEMSFNGIYLDLKSNSFYTKKSALTGQQLLDAVYEAHSRTSKMFYGGPARARVWFHQKVIVLLWLCVVSIKWLLSDIFSRELENDSARTNLTGYRSSDFKVRSSGDTIEILGYTISKPVAVICSVLILGAYSYRYYVGFDSKFLSGLGSPIIAPFSVFLLVWFLDTALPWGMFWFLNALIKFRTNNAVAKFSIHSLFSPV